MPNPLRLLLCSALLVTTVTAQELPAPSSSSTKPLEFEPQLIFGDPNAPPAGGTTTDLQKLENGLQRAKRNAVADEKLYKQGILAKIEAERSQMKVVQLTANLSKAKLQAARAALANLKEGTDEAKAAAETAVQEAMTAAETDFHTLHQAQIDAAALNVWRMQKLQSWGSASKAQVARAQEQLKTLAPPDSVEPPTVAKGTTVALPTVPAKKPKP